MIGPSEETLWGWLAKAVATILGGAMSAIVIIATWLGKKHDDIHAKIDGNEDAMSKKIATMQQVIADHESRMEVGENEFKHIARSLEEVKSGLRTQSSKMDTLLIAVTTRQPGSFGQ